VLALLSPIEDVSLYAIGQEVLWPIWAFWIGVVLLRHARPAVVADAATAGEFEAEQDTEEPAESASTIARASEPSEGQEA
jgi:hypothetical protein